MKYKFLNDYSEGCHPSILEKMLASNLSQQSGYGNDEFSLNAVKKIKAACKNKAVDVHFVSGGTLANLLVISAVLRPYESVIAAESGHINTHEAGAIEATGHKIEYARTQDGKLEAKDIARLLMKFPKYHTVKPRLVYISNSTEWGTIYSKAELEEIYDYCQNNDLLLFIDGARLAMALTAEENDLTLADVSRLCDVFYIGGTKAGAMLGEAIVVCNPALQQDFQYNIKQRGAMLAKGRFLGIQFETLFSENLIFEQASKANQLAGKMVTAFQNNGYNFLCRPQTNQIFPILPHRVIRELGRKYEFFEWEEVDEDHAALRLVTSWATSEKAVDQFIRDLEAISKKDI